MANVYRCLIQCRYQRANKLIKQRILDEFCEVFGYHRKSAIVLLKELVTIKMKVRLPQEINSLINGNYTPHHLKRYYFVDEMVDQLHISDRVLQHILFKELKPTFKHVMSPNCYHLHGPTGVKYATERIQKILREEKPITY